MKSERHGVEKQAALLQLVSEPSRQRMLLLVWDQELSASQIAHNFDTTFGAVSQHLSKLRQAGIVRCRKDGKMRLYRAEKAALGPLAQFLESMWRMQLHSLKHLAEAEEKKRG